MRTKNIYQFRGWEGTDVNVATSLFEYGLLYNPRAKKDQCNIIYGVTVDKNGDYTSFAYSSVNWEELVSCNWIEWDKVYSFSGTTEENYKEFSVHALSDLVAYYGSAEIFGENYYEGFKVNGH